MQFGVFWIVKKNEKGGIVESFRRKAGEESSSQNALKIFCILFLYIGENPSGPPVDIAIHGMIPLWKQTMLNNLWCFLIPRSVEVVSDIYSTKGGAKIRLREFPYSKKTDFLGLRELYGSRVEGKRF